MSKLAALYGRYIIHFDVETIKTTGDMCAIAFAVFDLEERKLVDAEYVALKSGLEGDDISADTLQWFKTMPDLFAHMTEQAVSFEEARKKISLFISKYPEARFAAWPISFDWRVFFNTYMRNFPSDGSLAPLRWDQPLDMSAMFDAIIMTAGKAEDVKETRKNLSAAVFGIAKLEQCLPTAQDKILQVNPNLAHALGPLFKDHNPLYDAIVQSQVMFDMESSAFLSDESEKEDDGSS